MTKLNFKAFAFLLSISVTSFSIFSCNKEPAGPDTAIYNKGIFIINEGPFQTGTGTISFYNRETGEVINNIFEKENTGRVLGNIVQSLTIIDNIAYIVVNNAQKVEVAEAGTFKSVATITGLDQPRYLLPIDDSKAYISQYGADGTKGEIKIVNLTTNSIIGSIAVGTGPERMVKLGNKVYVANGGFCSIDRRITVINSDTDEVIDHIEVGDNPVALQVDRNEDIWVITKGNFDCTDYSTTPSALVRISNGRVAASFELPNGAGNLSINNARDRLYYTVGGGVYEHNITATTLNQAPVIQKFFYALSIDPMTDLLFCADAKDFQSNGEVMIYAADGTLTDSLEVGIIPAGFWFQ